jgi:hypothetical protein
MVEIVFTETQRARAMAEANRRQAVNEKSGLQGRNKGPAAGAKALEIHQLGAAGELAVAVYLEMEEHVFTNELPVRGSADLPGKIDVKTIPKSFFNLLVQLDDDLDKTYVLVIIENRRIFIKGWIHGSMINKDWKKEPVPGRPCYVVPQSVLNPIEDLKCRVEAA